VKPDVSDHAGWRRYGASATFRCVESVSRHTPRKWPVVVLRFVVLATATAFAVLATILGGIAQNRVPADARWTSIGTYPEFWVAVASGLIAAGLVASSSMLARWFGSVVQRRSAAGRDRALVVAYLRARISAWNRSDWGIEVPSTVERRLTVTTVADGREGSEPRTFTEEAALDGRGMLVILGGPGSGKTWLARRYARRAAEAALALLDGGTGLAEIELPVYTTWDHWAQLADTAGDGMRAGLVVSSFGADVHHGGGETNDVVVALKEILNRDETRVLFVIDSLDEATGKDHATRVGNLTGLADHQARVVITSRPGAWDLVSNRMPVLDDARLVVELRDLSYPEDVEPFVEAWFADDPERATGVTAQLRTRYDVARAAVVPLILTFYCLVAADGAPSAPLPARRHDLYDRIIAQSLARANKNVGADPDYRYTERVNQLRAWAWHAVGTSNTSAGLGDWGETFVPLSPPSADDHLALDALAPRVGVTRERTVRRFQHRTILEHLVAEYLATLDADEAVDILTPHLWFDTDWEVAAPAALAAHNRAQPGELLDRVLHVMNPVDPDAEPAQQEAQRELARVVITAAADSEPDEWGAEHQELIGVLRLDSLGWAPDLATRTAHWLSSPGFVEEALNRMRTTDEVYVAAYLAETLAALTISDNARARAIASVLERITTADDNYEAGLLAESSTRLITSDVDRGRVITAVIDRIATADNVFMAGDLLKSLAGLIVSDGDRGRVITAVLEQIVTADSDGTAGGLAKALAGLIVSDRDRGRVITAVLERLASTDRNYLAEDLIEALVGLIVSDGDRERVLVIVFDRLAVTDDGFLARGLAKALVGLIVSDGDRERALAAVLDRIIATPATAKFSDDFVADSLAEVLPGLIVSDRDRGRVLSVVLDRLAITENDFMVGDLAEAFKALGPSAGDRERVLTLVLDRIDTIDDDSVVDRLVGVLPGLIVSDGDRGRVLSVVLDRLATTQSDFTVSQLAEALRTLRPSDDDRERALTVVLDWTITTDDSYVVRRLVEVLPGLIVSDADRGRALTVVLDRITASDDDSVTGLVAEALPGLIVSDADRGRALTVVLDRLPTTDDSYAAFVLAEAVPDLARGIPDILNTLRRHTTLAGRPLSPALVSRTRRILACPDWLGLLQEGPQA
jgi:hypothetical protein